MKSIIRYNLPFRTIGVLKVPLLYVNTISHLKFVQIVNRITRKITLFDKPFCISNCIIALPKNIWVHFPLNEITISQDLTIKFLNVEKRLEFPKDWEDEVPSKLWVYNLNYFDCLMSTNLTSNLDANKQLLEAWVSYEKQHSCLSLDPYPTSLRIVNTIKIALAGVVLDSKIYDDLYAQANFLTQKLELHLLGNHYFANLKALLFSGLFFSRQDWVKFSIQQMKIQLKEQILKDGGHFERSPMYHNIILTDMLDIFNLLSSYDRKEDSDFLMVLRKTIMEMFKFSYAMGHPDGGVSFFNDSVDGIAPKTAELALYAKRLGLKPPNITDAEYRCVDLSSSGYFCCKMGPAKLIFDAAPIGPDYIPGHAHADTNCFELSIGKQRFIVNSGIFDYEDSDLRHYLRGTKSHNSVVINNKDSSEIWKSFRVGKRAKVVARSKKFVDNGVVLESTHDGYQNWFGGCLHKRTLALDGASLSVKDEVLGSFQSAYSRFFFHPYVKVELSDKNMLMMELDKIKIFADLKGVDVNVFSTNWYPEFGKSMVTKGIEIAFSSNVSEIKFIWNDQGV